jgi:hypothetical protein
MNKRNTCAITITVTIEEKDKQLSVQTYALVGYNYQSKKIEQYLMCRAVYTELLLIKLENQKEKSDNLNKQLKEQTKTLELEADKKAKEDGKNSVYMYVLIVLVVILGFSNLYLLSTRKIPVEDENDKSSEFDPNKTEKTPKPDDENPEEESSSCCSDEKPHTKSTAHQHTSKDYTPMLVRHSYYEEHGTDSQITEEEKTLSESEDTKIKPDDENPEEESSSCSSDEKNHTQSTVHQQKICIFKKE